MDYYKQEFRNLIFAKAKLNESLLLKSFFFANLKP